MFRRLKLHKGSRKNPRHLWSLLALLLILSAYQYYDQGKITWHQSVLAEIGDYPGQWVREWNRPAHKSPPPPRGQQLTGTVVEVTDGDTLILLTSDWNEYAIRLYGIDAPEYNQPHGSVASSALARLVDDKEVKVTIEDIDNYNRPVGKVTLDGDDINLAMVKDGHAWWYRQYAKSNLALADAEQNARKQDAGLWVDNNPVPPWIWRRKH